FQPPALQLANLAVENGLQCTQQGMLSLRILRHVQREAALGSYQKGIGRPVTGIDLTPQRTAILQLGQRLQLDRTGCNRPQILAADTWQIENRRDTLRQ